MNLPDLLISKIYLELDEMIKTEFICTLDSSDLFDHAITWKYNRTINNSKVKQIKERIYNKSVLDTMIYFYIDKNNLICYDGNHRLQALKELYIKDETINIKVICHIMIPQTNNIDIEIRNRFSILNLNTPIPDITIDIMNNLDILTPENVEKTRRLNARKSIIENVFNEYKKIYKPFYMTSNKPRKPNFNDTMFYDLCNGFYFETKNELIKILIKRNNDNKTRQMKEGEKIKCNLYKFYVFN
jgi:hypothetical protein